MSFDPESGLKLELTITEIRATIPDGIKNSISLCIEDGDTVEDLCMRWLEGRTNDFATDDRKAMGSRARVRAWIHRAVECTGGTNYYNGKPLDWDKIGPKFRDEPNAPSVTMTEIYPNALNIVSPQFN
jgi:hypothetical protein